MSHILLQLRPLPLPRLAVFRACNRVRERCDADMDPGGRTLICVMGWVQMVSARRTGCMWPACWRTACGRSRAPLPSVPGAGLSPSRAQPHQQAAAAQQLLQLRRTPCSGARRPWIDWRARWRLRGCWAGDRRRRRCWAACWPAWGRCRWSGRRRLWRLWTPCTRCWPPPPASPQVGLFQRLQWAPQ